MTADNQVDYSRLDETVFNGDFDFYFNRYREAERIVISLRRKLRALDPSLPHEYDGAAWQPIEAEHLDRQGEPGT